ncbi:trigger factor [Patescibacteria group bacterium]|nr:trigger factor [Patescibacteria group bacterium]
MKTSLKKLPKSQAEILFEISVEEFKGFIEKTISNLAKDLEIEGFRKDKAPKEIVIKKVGQEKILASAVQLAVRKNYLQTISQLADEIEVISQPEIKILSEPTFDKGLIFKAQFSVMPEINLPDYKKIASETKRREVFVKEKEVEDALSWLQKSRAKFIFKNQPAEKKDFVEIEFSSPKIEGNLKRHDNFILGEGSFVKGFEENLEKMSAGQEKEFSLIFPENHFRKGLAGKKVHFKVKMKSVQTVIFPEINDQFAKSLGRFENLVALKENIKEGLKIEKENHESQRARQEILEKIAQKTKLEIPGILIEAEKKRMADSLKKLVSEKLKISFEDYLTKIKKTEKELLDTFFSESERKIKYSLVLRKISKIEKIEVSEEEIKTEINKILKNYSNIKKTEKDLARPNFAEQNLGELDSEKLKGYYKEAIQNEKTLKFLEGLATSQQGID